MTETQIFVPKAEQKCTCNSFDQNTKSIDGLTGESFRVCHHCNLPLRNAFDSIDQLSDILSLDDDPSVSMDAPNASVTTNGFVRDQMIGRQLGDFQIQERIGSGGMARVYLAFDSVLKRHVAVKVIQNKKYVTRDSQAKLLQAEAISQASLHHPNVVSIFYVGTHEELPFLAMEYVDGPSLNDRIENGPLPFGKVLCYARQIVGGLCEAYRTGLIHGDIKPANLLVNDDDIIKLSDFGLARHLHDEYDAPKQLVGTPSFMAPELFDKHPIDEQTDLFSLGVTLFQLTFGTSPYTLFGETAEEVKLCLEKAAIEFPEDCDHIPLAWKNILCKLLAKSRSERYRSIQELQADVQRIAESPVPAKPVPRLTSLIVDNLSLLFFSIPLIVATTLTNSVPIQMPQWFWAMGPIAWVLLSVARKQSLGHLMTSTIPQAESLAKARAGFLKYQLMSLLPAILIVLGTISVSSIGPSFGLTAISLGLSALVCSLINSASSGIKLSFAERVSQARLVVDA